MKNAIAGFFRTRAEGEAAQDALQADGFTRDEVSFVVGDQTTVRNTPAVGPAPGVAAEEEAGQDAFIGGAVGLGAGAIAGVLPIAGLIALGPLGAALGGLAAGTALGGLVGILRDHGVSDEEAEFYAQGVKSGGSLIALHEISGDREKRAREILKEHGALDVEEVEEDEPAPEIRL
jgi:hypothetical protein